MPAHKNLKRRIYDIERWLDEGLSQGEIANRLGCHRKAVNYWCQKLGLRSKHPCNEENAILVEVNGEWASLQATAQKYGLYYRTVHHRYHQGDRGEDLIRPARKCVRPNVYRLGIPWSEWRVYREFGMQVGARSASKTLGIPSGAIGAAIRGEWERLA